MSISSSISVICPCFNAEKSIWRLLQTVDAQIVQPLELIIYDDGSTDGTIQIIEEYVAARKKDFFPIKPISGAHSGPGAARNFAVEHSKGTWLAFIDADDYWLPHKLKIVSEFIQNHSDIGVWVHWENFEFLNGSARIIKNGNKIRYLGGAKLSRSLYQLNDLSTSATCVKAEYFQKVAGFDVKLPNGQDYDLWLKLSRYSKFGCIPEILGSYVQNSASISARPYHKRIKSELIIWWRYRCFGVGFDILVKLVRILVNKAWIR